MECLKCRDLGSYGGCSDCGKDSSKIQVHTQEFSQEILAKDFNVPSYYINNVWDSDKLKKSLPDFKDHHAFQKYCSLLDDMYNIFKRGKFPIQSLLIVAPRLRGKQIFVYSCMQEAIKHGLTVGPYLDTSEIKRLNILSADRSYSPHLNKLPYSIEDILEADILFVTVDLDNFHGAYRTLDSLLSKRSRRGKPTYIVSRYPIEMISALDKDQEFFKIVDNSKQRDRLKSLQLIIGV